MRAFFKSLIVGTAALAAVSLSTAFNAPAASAQETPVARADDAALALRTHLAFVRTGDIGVDRTTEAGLNALARVLYVRTGLDNFYVERGAGDVHSNPVSTGPVLVRGIDPATDDLSLYPFLYFAVDANQPMLSATAIDALNLYMRSGGLLFIDTRDEATAGRGRTWLQRLNDAGLDIPVLQRVEGCTDPARDCHVIGKSYYLMERFPGRADDGALWAENTQTYRAGGVATVVIGGNDWAGAWASGGGRDLYSVAALGADRQELAYRAGVNFVMYAFTGNYKADQVHIPAILDRMGDAGRVPRP